MWDKERGGEGGVGGERKEWEKKEDLGKKKGE
jgi:hypothetical protein